ncbi:MAG: carbohydrate ABC transporter permease [Thermoprotei archaeon]|mgnify:CR=1 FL=1|nr:MAG: carbohydrate ABC transporter permease [Thermoprotei archaeon]
MATGGRSSRSWRYVSKVLKALVILGVAVIPLVPIWSMVAWLAIQSFSKKVTLGLVPLGLSIENWRFLWSPVRAGLKEYPNIWPVTINTLLLALGVSMLVVLVSTLGGYAISRIDFKGRTLLMEFIIALHAFPSIILLIALFIILNKLGLYGKGIITLIGIAIIKAGLEIPMSTWIIKGFFDSIPWDLEWAALVDGCSRLKAWKSVILPQVLPGIAAVAIFSFLAGWSEFLLVFTYVKDETYYTLPVLLYHMIGEFKFIDWGLLAAMGLFYTIPTLLFFTLTQKVLLRIYVGGVKG